MNMETITPKQFGQRMKSDSHTDLIDVRTPAEFREAHLPGARSAPLDRLDPREILSGRNARAGDPIYLVCRGGGRAKAAQKEFLAHGFNKSVVIEGGLAACESEGFELMRGKKSMSLERQVRIAAGSLVLGGAVLAAIVHPIFLGLSGFVGAGLIFAGISDTCAMGMLLARMPWNQTGA